MALTDGAVILPGRGYVYTNTSVGAAAPAKTQTALAGLNLDSATLTTGWNNMGHTSRENNVTIAKDGEDGEILGTWQKPSLRQSTPSVTWSVNVNALQLDNDVMRMYFGEGDITDPDAFHVLAGAGAIERAVFIVLVDGASRAGLYLPKVSITSDDAPEFDPEAFLEFSLKMTVLDHTGADGLMSWYRTGLGTPA